MPTTYEKIATTTLSSTAATITLSSIPATYTDLILAVNIGVDVTGSMQVRLNGDTGANYSTLTLIAYNNTVTGSGVYGPQSFMYANVASGLPLTVGPASAVMQFNNYSNSTTYKTMLARYANVGIPEVDTTVSTWRNTAAITSITLFSYSASVYLVGTRVTLYGIKAA
jgi:hypothetical protein